ncbi:MAG: hypothetical protein KTQ49_02410 [Candidatus Omnitrophica bacterium]|nr:hypothetical protein [Candidatus Omnitrophota bacterium]
MIQVNLLPPEFRKANKKITPIPYLPLVVLGGGLFTLLTLFFYIDFLAASYTHGTVKKEWLRLNPLMAQLKTLEKRVDGELRVEKDFLDAHVFNTLPVTQLMMWVSESLPLRGWLTHFEFERQGEGCHLGLEGVVFPANNQTGIEQIEIFLHAVKKRLPAATLNLTTSKANVSEGDGTAFVANFDWGTVKKP